jgi:hypothetical protein
MWKFPEIQNSMVRFPDGSRIECEVPFGCMVMRFFVYDTKGEFKGVYDNLRYAAYRLASIGQGPLSLPPEPDWKGLVIKLYSAGVGETLSRSELDNLYKEVWDCIEKFK